MKKCTLCKEEKPLSEFTLRLGKPASRCRPCLSKSQKEYRKQWETRAKASRTKREDLPNCLDPKYRLALGKKLKDERYHQLLDYLKEHPCVDCGETNLLVLEFDHVRGTKVGNVCWMAERGARWERIFEEIQKCEVRCANCHAIKTHKHNNSRRYRLLNNTDKVIS